MTTFLAIVVIQTLVCICLVVAIIHQVITFMEPHGFSGGDLFTVPFVGFQPALILFVEALYQLFLTLDAGRRKNIIQIIGICFNNASIFIAIVLSYDNIQLTWVKRSHDPKIQTMIREFLAVSVTLGVCGVVLAIVSWLGFREFEW
jgi:hypothetical protein